MREVKEHCPNTKCVWYREEHCYYWKDGKCTVLPDFLALTEPIWNKEVKDGS